jgi:23S rRNA (pseudouridine1915-N3)-methyltransferase
MNIQIITIGNKPDRQLSEMIDNFTKRLPRTISLDWLYLKHGSGDPAQSMKQESENILKKISPGNSVILLDETGEQLSSPALSEKLFNSAKNVTIIIGGAYGIDQSIFDCADFTWSLSKLVFPHQIVRLVLAEQIYRAHTISINHPYHHG